jgi:hypothetical protein
VFEWDRRPAALAVSVGTDLKPVKRGVDVREDGFCSHCQGVGDLLSGRIFDDAGSAAAGKVVFLPVLGNVAFGYEDVA